MIPDYHWLVLLGGYSLSGLLVFYSDFKREGNIYDGAWLPAILTVAWFYSGLQPEVAFLLIIRGLPIAGATYFILWLFSKKIGAGDAIALGIFAFWPDLLYSAVVFGSLIFFALNVKRRYMMKFKLAGILGFLALPIGAYLLLV